MIAELPRLDVFVANAAISHFSWQTTSDGWKEQLQVNCLATGLLAVSLLPLMAKTAALPVSDGLKQFKPHLTIVSSSVHEWVEVTPAQGSILDDLNDPTSPNGAMVGPRGPSRYYLTKLISLHLAQRIAALKAAAGVIVNAVNPGLSMTDLYRTAPAQITDYLTPMSIPASEGAKNLAWAATADIDTEGAYVDELKVVEPAGWGVSQARLAFRDGVFKEMAALWVKFDPAVEAVLA